LREWDAVIREKFEERLMSDDPMEYALTAEGSVIARLIEEGKVSDTAWFEPGVA